MSSVLCRTHFFMKKCGGRNSNFSIKTCFSSLFQKFVSFFSIALVKDIYAIILTFFTPRSIMTIMGYCVGLL